MNTEFCAEVYECHEHLACTRRMAGVQGHPRDGKRGSLLEQLSGH